MNAFCFYLEKIPHKEKSYWVDFTKTVSSISNVY